MSLENTNKKALLIVLVLIVLLFAGISHLLFIVLFLLFLFPFLIGISRFLKSDKVTKKEILKRYFFNIYWKKNLLFLLIFIIADFLLKVVISIDLVGLPIPYYQYNPISFSPIFFILDIFFWYTVVGLIIKRPVKISRNIVKLNYITLGIVLLVIFHLLLGYLASSHLIDDIKLDKKKIEECEMLSDKREDNEQYSKQFNCYVDYAIRNNDIELCRLAKHKKEFDLDGWGWGYMSEGEEVCYEEVAFKTLNYSICNNIDNLENTVCTNAIIKAHCYSRVAVAKGDGSICHHIGNLEKGCEKETEKIKEIMDECYSKINSK